MGGEESYRKRGKFFASSFREAELYGRPLDEPQRVRVSNPLVGDEETVLHKLFGKQVSIPDDEISIERRLKLDAHMKKAARAKGYDAIVIMHPAAFGTFRTSGRLPRSMELNLLVNEPKDGAVGVTGNLRPPLKWAGGKRWLVPHLRELWAPHRKRRLVEPLCGGLAVTLGLLPSKALLNDGNPQLINFYEWLKKGLRVQIPMRNDVELYYAHRDRFNELLKNGRGKSKEVAELFYYLNRTGYNGLCRFNRSGEFNVPVGQYKHINYTRDFLAFREGFAHWTFTSGDFAGLSLEASDFVYADPPYDVEFTQYAKEGFDWDAQVRLAEWLAKHKGPVVVSNQATKRIKRLYKRMGFKLRYLTAPRRISCTGDRTPATEVLAYKGL